MVCVASTHNVGLFWCRVKPSDFFPVKKSNLQEWVTWVCKTVSVTSSAWDPVRYVSDLDCRTSSPPLDTDIYSSFRWWSDASYTVCICCGCIYLLSPSCFHIEHYRWGQSAGAVSVALQLFAYDGNTEGLYRGAIMQSGTHIPYGDIADGQQYYDALIQQTGCSNATDTLACLREVPYEQLMIAINTSPSIISYQVSFWCYFLNVLLMLMVVSC